MRLFGILSRAARVRGDGCFTRVKGLCYALLEVENPECIARLLYGEMNILEFLIGSCNMRGLLLYMEPLDRSKAMRSLEAKMMTYRVILERNPDDKTAEARLEILSRMYKRVAEGYTPLKARYVIVIADPEPCSEIERRLETAKRTLEIHGCRCRVVCSDLNSVLSRRAEGPLDSMTAIDPLVTMSRRIRSYREGVFIGRDMDTGLPIYLNLWDERRGANHVLIVGPTGKGKTTLLATLLVRLYALDSTPLTAIDPKGDLIDSLKSIGVAETVVDTGMVASILGQLYREGTPISMILEAGVELTGAERRAIDALLFCKDTTDPYASSAAVKLRVMGLPVEKLCREPGEPIPLGGGRLEAFDLSSLSNPVKNIAASGLLALIHAMYSSGSRRPRGLRRVIVVDEAWRAMKMPKELLERLVKEFRSYGVSLVLASQDPGDIPDTAWNNASLVVVFGSHDKSFIEQVGRVLRLTERDLERLRWLHIGEAALKLADDPRPVFVRVEPEPEIIKAGTASQHVHGV